MTDQIMLIPEFFVPFLYAYVFSKLMTLFLGKKNNRIIAGRIGWGCFIVYQILTNHFINFINPWIMISINIFILFLIGIIERGASLMRSAFFAIIVCVINMLMEVAGILIMTFIGVDSSITNITGGYMASVLLLIMDIILSRTKREKRHNDIPLKIYSIILIIPIVTIILMNWLFMIASIQTAYANIAIISGCFFLLMNYIIFEVYDRISLDAELKSENRLYCKQLELCSAQASDQENFYAEIRRTRHDMKNHLTGLFEMIKQGHNKEACEYIERLLKDGINVNAEEISRSGNIIIDSLINHKYKIAKENGIKFDATVFVPSKLEFRSDHLVIILGNLLENALEACYKVAKGLRYINVEVSYEKGILHICIKNSCISEKRRGSDGAYFTTKEDKENHGIGLSSVRKAVKYYDGEVKIKDNIEDFTVVAILYGIH
ncbi:ATP-binding protein [Butyrivibrio sp. XB500-5]|uniref:sensor histidine kinase n=1 Tax=Butyrivibrio sp. XB500-5 TaxID=2364880 RepID=UPI000EA9C2D3|nr:ATP-binding protein [Butyrivibrio sp. XB500-5]RKM62782.1 ATP-binding protein [Butyrivibrio sp. XB500-5]